MIVEVDNARWGEVDGLPFWSLVSSSEAATSDMLILWVWEMRSQWLWGHLSLSMLQESRERLIKCQSSQNYSFIGSMMQPFPQVPIFTHKSLTDMYNEKLFYHKHPRNLQQKSIHQFHGKGTR